MAYVIAFHQPEEIMKNTKNTSPNKDEAAAVPNHTERIKSQVLAKIGKPPRLDHLEISRHHKGKYRINIWQQPEPDKNITVTTSPRIGLSYYLTVSDTGEIIDSNPPMPQLGSPA
jgi:hypothetical protein